MSKHFKLTAETKLNEAGITLHRIRATRDSLHAKKGDLGGWVERLDNLEMDAWVADEAELSEYAVAFDQALIRNKSKVFGNSSVYENALIDGNAVVCGDVLVHDKAVLGYGVRLTGNLDVRSS